MSERAFKLSLFALVATIFLSSTTFPGALIGFFCGVGIAFFVAGPSFLAAAALQKLGVPATEKTIVIILIGLYGVLALASLFAAWRAIDGPNRGASRLACFRAALVFSLPLIGILSSDALVRAWRI